VKTIKRHLTMNIDHVLSLSDKYLEDIFASLDISGKEIRKGLEDDKKKGHKLIGSKGCDGFCPINGCPGHEVKEEA